MFKSLVVHPKGHPAETPLGVTESAVKYLKDVFFRKRFQLKHLASRKQCRVYIEERVFYRSSDKRERALLHVGQEGVLLELVEPVDLVQEKYRLYAAPPVLAGALYYAPELVEPRSGCV